MVMSSTQISLLTMENDLNDIVAMVKLHPDGIPVNKLAVFYNQKYHKNLTVADLGFTNMASLIASLDKDLVVQRGKVFHKMFSSKLTGTRAAAGAGAGAGSSAKATEESRQQDKETHSGKGPPVAIPDVTLPQVDVRPKFGPPPHTGITFGTHLDSVPALISTHSSPVIQITPASKPAETLTQQQLYQRVTEVSCTHSHLRIDLNYSILLLLLFNCCNPPFLPDLCN